jgi:hypothetical protein
MNIHEQFMEQFMFMEQNVPVQVSSQDNRISSRLGSNTSQVRRLVTQEAFKTGELHVLT